jgi:hypothetical protein
LRRLFGIGIDQEGFGVVTAGSFAAVVVAVVGSSFVTRDFLRAVNTSVNTNILYMGVSVLSKV